MLGLAEIRVSAAAHLLSNEDRSWTAARSARRRTAAKGNEADGSAARFRAEGELAVNRRQVFKELPNLEVAFLKNKKNKQNGSRRERQQSATVRRRLMTLMLAWLAADKSLHWLIPD